MRITLRFQTKIDPEAILAGLPLRIIRLMVQVRLATPEGWSPIGFEDILTPAVLHCDYAAGLAYLDL